MALSVVILGSFPCVAARSSELDDRLGLSIENVSTNTVVISTNLLDSVSHDVFETPMDVLVASPDPFFPDVAFRAVMQWGESGGVHSGRVVVRQFATASNALQWVQLKVHGTTMLDDNLASHYSTRPDVADVCLCWHTGETNKLDSSISSVTILRGNLVTVTSGTPGTNLVKAASYIMDAFCTRPLQ